MLPLADAVKVNPVGPTEAIRPTAPVADARQEAFERSIQRLVGQQLQGEILSRLKDGTFLVNVAGTATRMTLPTGAQVGTSVPMTLVSLLPRPTFLLGTETGNPSNLPIAAAAHAETEAGNLPVKPLLVYLESGATLTATPANANVAGQLLDSFDTEGLGRTQQGDVAKTAAKGLTATQDADVDALLNIPKGSAPASLSTAGRLIDTLLKAAQNAPTTLLGNGPLVASSNAAPAHVAAALHEALASSGLFYESHVAEWAAGTRSLAELQREPQMQTNPSIQRAAQLEGNAVLQSDMKSLELAPLINLQLNALEHQTTQWRGDIWPGQPMEWEVSRDAPERGNPGAGEEEQQAWQSAVRFNFPILGSILATIHLNGEHLHIQVSTTSEDTANSLRAHIGELSEALAAAGSTLDSLTVKQDEAT